MLNITKSRAINGGAIFVNNTFLTINFATLTYNNAALSGGAIYLNNTKNHLFTNMLVDFNRAVYGGAIFGNAVTNITISGSSNNKYRKNYATYGGVFFFKDSKSACIKNTI